MNICIYYSCSRRSLFKRYRYESRLFYLPLFYFILFLLPFMYLWYIKLQQSFRRTKWMSSYLSSWNFVRALYSDLRPRLDFFGIFGLLSLFTICWGWLHNVVCKKPLQCIRILNRRKIKSPQSEKQLFVGELVEFLRPL